MRALADKAASLGTAMQVVNTAGLSPNMAPPEQVLNVDLYGSAVVFEEFERVIAPGGAGLIISSMAGHMVRQLPEDQEEALAHLPADELLDLQFLKDIPNLLVGYMVAKRANQLHTSRNTPDLPINLVASRDARWHADDSDYNCAAHEKRKKIRHRLSWAVVVFRRLVAGSRTSHARHSLSAPV